MESFEHMGYWWLPEEPSEPIGEIPQTAIPGKLSFDPATGAVLELLGNLDTEGPYGMNLWKKFEIIQGFVSGSDHCVTLQGCYVTSASLGSTLSETKLIVNYIFTGYRYWFDSIDDIVFEYLSVGYTYLNDWMFQKNFDFDMTRTDYKRMMDYSVSYTTPEPIEIPLDNATIELWSASGTSSTITEVSLTDEYRITITPQEPIRLFEYLKFINFHLPNFLTLATGHTNFPLNVSGRVSEDRGRMSIHYKVTGYTEKTDRLTPWPMLFAYNDVKEDLPRYLANWIRKSEKLEATYNLYFREHYSKLIVLDSELLSLAQALEAYHRNVYGGEYRSKEEYEPIRIALIDAIPDCVDNSHRDALEGTLKYGNQFSLRTRLKKVFNEVLSEQSDDLKKLVGNPREFMHRLVETRNYLTHRDGERNSAVLNDDELYEFTRKMRMLMQICFLKEMEFPPSEITRLLNANQEYQHLTKDNKA